VSGHPTPLGGTCSARFDPLRELFAAKLASGEDLGASLAVNIDGEMVVDLWGGWADEARCGEGADTKRNRLPGRREEGARLSRQADPQHPCPLPLATPGLQRRCPAGLGWRADGRRRDADRRGLFLRPGCLMPRPTDITLLGTYATPAFRRGDVVT